LIGDAGFERQEVKKQRSKKTAHPVAAAATAKLLFFDLRIKCFIFASDIVN